MILNAGEELEELFEDKKIIQNRNLYRFTSDSVILSEFVKGGSKDVVADFCSGCGIVGFHFLCLNPGIKSVTLFEMQKDLSSMAERTKEYNSFDKAEIVCGRLQDIGSEFNDRFSIILCNPPYETRTPSDMPRDMALCRCETAITLDEICGIAFKKLKYGGKFALLSKATRLAELFYTLKNRGLEPKRLMYIKGKDDKKPYLVACEAVKGGKVGLEILPDCVNSAECGVGTTHNKS